MYALRRRLDDGPQAGLTVAERVLHAFALIDVGVQDVPTENGAAGVPNGKPTNLKTTIRAVEASEARLEFIGLTRCELCSEDLRQAREVIWVKRIAGRPLLQVLECPTAVLEESVVAEVERTRRCHNGDHAGNGGQGQSCIVVAGASCCFGSLTFHDKLLLQPFIGFGQFSRPFRDASGQFLSGSVLFFHVPSSIVIVLDLRA